METQLADSVTSAKSLSPTRSRLLYWVALGVLLLGSLAVRLFGIGWGIPNFNVDRMPHSEYRNSYHIDEDNYLWGLVQMRPSQANFDVADYHWGTLQYYLIYNTLLTGEAVGLLPSPWEDAFRAGDVDAIRKMYELGRLVSATAGVVGVLIVVALGTLAAGRTAGLGAGAAYAIAPFAVVEAHYMTSDVVMSVLVAASLLASILAVRRANIGWLLGAGLLMGLAISAKYSAAFAAPGLFMAQWFAWRSHRSGASSTARILVFSSVWLAVLLGFFVGEPYALLSPNKLMSGLQITIDGNATDPSWGFGPPIRMAGWQMENLAWFGLTLPLALLALGGIVVLIVRGLRRGTMDDPGRTIESSATSVVYSPSSVVLVAALAGLLVGLAINRVFMLRYSQPLVPLLCVAAAVGWTAIPRGSLRLASGVIALGVAGVVTLGQISIMADEHPANTLLAWLDTNLKPGQEVARVWPEYPPLDGGSFKLVRLDPWRPAMPPGENPDYIIMDNMLLGPPSLELTNLIASDYHEVARFSEQPHIGSLSWDEGITPHDWKYTHPTFIVYAKQ